VGPGMITETKTLVCLNISRYFSHSECRLARLLSRAGSTSSRDSCSPALSNETVVVLVLDGFTIQDGWGRVRFRIFRICEENRQSWN
jgi:hypothetical protein